MNRTYCRRTFIQGSLTMGATAALAFPSHLAGATAMTRPKFPVADYHVHLSPGLSIEQAVNLGKERQVQIGILGQPSSMVSVELGSRRDLSGYLNKPGLESRNATMLHSFPASVGTSAFRNGFKTLARFIVRSKPVTTCRRLN